ncbi:MAG: hypothetical protein N4A76_08680 [Firmicutes bacterium]|jgi:hypothetical protein|nr:hypothetical protein [Bacillota bacterium]
MKFKIINKFDYDVKNISRIKRLLLSVDQFLNVLLWNGSQDETISGHIGRKIKNGKANKFEKLLCYILNKMDKNHCNDSIGE